MRIHFIEQNIKVSEKLKYRKILVYLLCTTLNLSHHFPYKVFGTLHQILHKSTTHNWEHSTAGVNITVPQRWLYKQKSNVTVSMAHSLKIPLCSMVLSAQYKQWSPHQKKSFPEGWKTINKTERQHLWTC